MDAEGHLLSRCCFALKSKNSLDLCGLIPKGERPADLVCGRFFTSGFSAGSFEEFGIAGVSARMDGVAL